MRPGDDVLLRYGSGLNWIWDVGLSTGTGFSPAGNWYWGRGGTTEPVYTGDFDGDGRNDVLLRYGSGINWIWDVGLSTGSGFRPAGNWYWARGGTTEPVYTGDFDGDGRDDVLLRYGSGLSWIWDVGLSTGTGFRPAGNWYWGRGGTTEPVYTGDFNGDGRDDVLLRYGSGTQLDLGRRPVHRHRLQPRRQLVLGPRRHRRTRLHRRLQRRRPQRRPAPLRQRHSAGSGTSASPPAPASAPPATGTGAAAAPPNPSTPATSTATDATTSCSATAAASTGSGTSASPPAPTSTPPATGPGRGGTTEPVYIGDFNGSP